MTTRARTPGNRAERRVGWTATLRLVARHQAGALIATAVDFATMIAAVELLHLRPWPGTLCGALVGALTNYTLGRWWIFDGKDALASPKRWQALRYALVSGASLGLNAYGVHALAELAGVQFVLARTIVVVSVSVGWNFPLHRYFVYCAPAAAPTRPAGRSDETLAVEAAAYSLGRIST